VGSNPLAKKMRDLQLVGGVYLPYIFSICFGPFLNTTSLSVGPETWQRLIFTQCQIGHTTKACRAPDKRHSTKRCFLADFCRVPLVEDDAWQRLTPQCWRTPQLGSHSSHSPEPLDQERQWILGSADHQGFGRPGAHLEPPLPIPYNTSCLLGTMGVFGSTPPFQN
jgi:hypothetical protein